MTTTQTTVMHERKVSNTNTSSGIHLFPNHSHNGDDTYCSRSSTVTTEKKNDICCHGRHVTWNEFVRVKYFVPVVEEVAEEEEKECEMDIGSLISFVLTRKEEEEIQEKTTKFQTNDERQEQRWWWWWQHQQQQRQDRPCSRLPSLMEVTAMTTTSTQKENQHRQEEEFNLKGMYRMIDFICPNPSCMVPLFEPCKCKRREVYNTNKYYDEV